MRKTLLGLGLAVALAASGCSQAEAPTANPSPRATTAQMETRPQDVAEVDLRETGMTADRAVDGSGSRTNRTDAALPGDEEDAKNLNKVAEQDVASLNEAKTGQDVDSPAYQISLKALQGNRAEQILGDLAEKTSKNAEVQAAGRMIAKDHAAAERELRAASLSQMPVNPALSEEQKALEAKLDALEGAAFDKAYVDAMVKNHEQDAAMYREQSKNAPTEALRAYFAQTLPVIEQHLERCRALQASLEA